MSPYDSPGTHVDALLIETPARLLRLPKLFLASFFGSFFWDFFVEILLGPHLADLLSTDRRWRDGIETDNEQP